MNSFHRMAITAALTGSLAACAGTQLQKAEMMAPTSGNTFDKALYAAYIDLSKGEYGEGDYRDSDAFAMRAMNVSSGAGSAPEEIGARKLPADKVDELTEARNRLVAAFAKDGKTKAPEAAARAQGNYECWMQEQEENFQPDDIARCRGDFMTAMASLDDATKVMARAEPRAEEATKRIDGIYVLFFDFDSDTLKPESLDVVRKAIADYKVAKPEKIYVSGHTDAAGTNAYNEKLSMRRVSTVIDAMKAGLVPENAFDTEAIGPAKPLVADGKNKREAKNRRVEIIFE